MYNKYKVNIIGQMDIWKCGDRGREKNIKCVAQTIGFKRNRDHKG